MAIRNISRKDTGSKQFIIAIHVFYISTEEEEELEIK